jgi:4-hydroxy-4-methyl-2-oxoglutarate aldolase
MSPHNWWKINTRIKTMPTSNPLLNDDEFRDLQALDSCSVADAIERFNVQLRNEGHTEGGLSCRFPQMGSMLGYAFTLQVRSYAPPTKRKAYDLENTQWWDELLALPYPRILVVQDMDRHPGAGALIGDLHATILKKLGCIGVVTNGAVREINRVQPLDFHMFSGHLSVSHSYSHVVQSGTHVQIGGLEINNGDLLHGDQHGIVRVPRELASRIPRTAQALRQKEADIAAYCASPDFSIEQLRALIQS